MNRILTSFIFAWIALGIMIAPGIPCPANDGTSRLWLVDGGYVDGKLSVSTTPNHVACHSPHFKEPIEFHLSVVEGVSRASRPLEYRVRPRRTPFANPHQLVSNAGSRTMTLTATGLKLFGSLQDSDGSWIWNSNVQIGAVPLSDSFSGRVRLGDYRLTEKLDTDAVQVAFVNGDVDLLKLIAVDTNRVLLQKDASKVIAIKAESILSITLGRTKPTLSFDASEIERLLTPPADKPSSQPTAIVISHTGDLLTGTDLRIGEQEVTFLARYKTIQVPRSRVAKVVWLKNTSEPILPIYPEAITVTQSQGRVLTVLPKQIRNGSLVGEHDWLGRLEIEFIDCESIWFGTAAIEKRREMLRNPLGL